MLALGCIVTENHAIIKVNMARPEPEQTQKKVKEKVVLSWIAPARPFKRRSRDFYITVVAMASLFGLVLLLVEGFMPILLMISLVFLFYVMSTVEPEDIEYQITNFGVKIAGNLTVWNDLGRFWFTKRLGTELLVIEARNLAGRMEIVIKPEIKEQIKKDLEEKLVHEEVPPSNMDKIANWFSKRLPS